MHLILTGKSPLMIALINRKFEVAKLLLAMEIQIDKNINPQNEALYSAIEVNDYKTAEILLKNLIQPK